MANETTFLQVASVDSEGESLHLTHVLTAMLPLNDAIARFYEKNLETYRYTFTSGHYGEESHIWEFSHHEAYEPVDPSLPALVILRYRPVNTERESDN